MTHTIEAFINQLQTDGVEAGREAAEEIRLEAEQQAQGRMAEATEQARRIVEGRRPKANSSAPGRRRN